MVAALFVINTYSPLSLVANPFFKFFMSTTDAKWSPVSPATLKGKYIDQLFVIVREYVIDSLRGRTACLVIDEMSKGEKSFYNLLLCTVGMNTEKAPVEIFFWKTTQLRCNDAESIGFLIGDTVRELREYGITVNSYSTDNCATMRATTIPASIVSLQTLKRIPCAAHALNNIMKDMMKEPVIGELWNHVAFMSLVSPVGSQGQQHRALSFRSKDGTCRIAKPVSLGRHYMGRGMGVRFLQYCLYGDNKE